MDDERGMTAFRRNHAGDIEERSTPNKDGSDVTYDIPFCTDFLQNSKLLSYIPICPGFRGFRRLCQHGKRTGPECVTLDPRSTERVQVTSLDVGKA